jgi:hypothetical protein
LRVSPHKAVPLRTQVEFLGIDYVTALIKGFHIHEIRSRTRPPLPLEEVESERREPREAAAEAG